MICLVKLLLLLVSILRAVSPFLFYDFFLNPYIDICYGNRSHRLYSKHCEKDLILSDRPENDCICLHGIWTSLDLKCSPRLYIGYKSCLKTKHIKSLRYIGTYGAKHDFFALVTVTKSSENVKSSNDWPDVAILRPVERATAVGATWVLNGRIVRQNSVYCVEYFPKNNEEIIRVYRLVGLVVVKSQCFSTIGIPVAPERSYRLNESISNHLRCKQDCSKIISEFPKSSNSNAVTLPPNNSPILRRIKINQYNYTRLARARFMAREKKDMEADSVLKQIQSEHKGLNTMMLHRSVKIAMNPGYSVFNYSRPADIPHYSFRILRKLIDITLKACSKIPRHFLYRTFNFFEAAYELRGSRIHEVFNGDSYEKTMEALDICAESISTMKFKNKASCENSEIDSYEIHPHIFIPINTTKDRYCNCTHVVLDTAWNMIDLTTAVCVGAFNHSYLLYHRWEQGMEKLFTNQLRTLWKFPEASNKFYTRLFGSSWQVWATNLEKCVEAAYIKQYKMRRLLPPLWTPGSEKRKHKFAFWRNHTLLYSMDGTQNVEDLRLTFPMTSKSESTKVGKNRWTNNNDRTLTAKNSFKLDCTKTYSCQSNT